MTYASLFLSLLDGDINAAVYWAYKTPNALRFICRLYYAGYREHCSKGLREFIEGLDSADEKTPGLIVANLALQRFNIEDFVEHILGGGSAVVRKEKPRRKKFIITKLCAAYVEELSPRTEYAAIFGGVSDADELGQFVEKYCC